MLYKSLKHFQLYKLKLSGYHNSSAGDSLTGTHGGRSFTTRDKDNDSYAASNCASKYYGAWWYGGCHSSNLNALNKNNATADYALSITWSSWRGQRHSLKSVQMAIKKN